MPAACVVRGAVEGIVDEAVFRRLMGFVRAEPGPVFGKAGKANLLKGLRGYNEAARFAPWLVIVDLDDDAECAPPFLTTHMAAPATGMCFRVAVREVESWILADRERLASFLRIDPLKVPHQPDTLPNPKQALVNLARRSRDAEIRVDLVPRTGSGRSEGPAYSSRLIEFVSDARHGWRPAAALRGSDSLARCVRRLRGVVSSAQRRRP
jgi:hypothetical protein